MNANDSPGESYNVKQQRREIAMQKLEIASRKGLVDAAEGELVAARRDLDIEVLRLEMMEASLVQLQKEEEEDTYGS